MPRFFVLGFQKVSFSLAIQEVFCQLNTLHVDSYKVLKCMNFSHPTNLTFFKDWVRKEFKCIYEVKPMKHLPEDPNW